MINGESLYVGEVAEIWYINGWYFLFEIPLYGGEPMYCGKYRLLEEAKNEMEAWT